MKNKLLIAGLLLWTTAVYSQVAVTNTGVLYIKSGSDIFYAANNFTNASSALLTNNGSLYVKGNLTNNQSSMPVGTGTLYLNGSSAQTISGTQTFKTYNLNTNNSSGLTLNNNLDVSGTHSFSSGIITTSATPNYLIYESGSSYSGVSNNAHVNGWVKKFGSTNFIFPTGDNTYLRPITLQNLSTNSEFNAQYSRPTVNPTSMQSPLVSMDPNEYWTVNEVSGGTAQVQLNWDNSKVGFPNYVLADIRAAFYSGSQWINEGGTATGTVSSAGTVTSVSVSSFGRFAIGSISFVVPLKFLGVSAVLENSSVKIKWQTANEIDVKDYEVQRSVDGIHFITIATVGAKNGDLQSYEHLDQSVPSSKLYYRVQANDLDGKIRFSGIVIVRLETVQKIQLVNNPVKNVIQLTTQNIPASVYSYQLINSAGQVCRKGNFTCGGSGFIAIPAEALAHGVYTLVIEKDNEQKEFKILIQ